MSTKGMKSVHDAACQILHKLLRSYEIQMGDDISQADLDGEQPITLHVCLTLADIRLARHVVRS